MPRLKKGNPEALKRILPCNNYNPAAAMLMLQFPELAYKSFRDKGHGFVYDVRNPKENLIPIAKIKHNPNNSHSVVVGNEILFKHTRMKNCLSFIRANILGITDNATIR